MRSWGRIRRVTDLQINAGQTSVVGSGRVPFLVRVDVVWIIETPAFLE